MSKGTEVGGRTRILRLIVLAMHAGAVTLILLALIVAAIFTAGTQDSAVGTLGLIGAIACALFMLYDFWLSVSERWRGIPWVRRRRRRAWARRIARDREALRRGRPGE